jgi:ferredoxin
VHDASHGRELIEATARHGGGLPARTIPLAVNEVTQVGLEMLAAGFAYGAASILLIARARPRHDIAGLHATVATANALLEALGYGRDLVVVVETDDPEELDQRARSAPQAAHGRAASFVAAGGKRDIMKTALRELHRAAPAPVDVVALPAGAPFGRVAVRTDGCTLCLACVSACPTRALSDAPDRPRLAFDESLCVQCGLCVATCPEKVMALEPRMSFAAFEAPAAVLKEEEPFCCIRCAKPFGVKSTIERIVRRLEAQHWMFSGDNRSRLDLIRMCEDCRVTVAVTSNIDPFAGPARPQARTSEDYLAERAIQEREAEMQRRIDKGEA